MVKEEERPRKAERGRDGGGGLNVQSRESMPYCNLKSNIQEVSARATEQLHHGGPARDNSHPKRGPPAAPRPLAGRPITHNPRLSSCPDLSCSHGTHSASQLCAIFTWPVIYEQADHRVRDMSLAAGLGLCAWGGWGASALQDPIPAPLLWTVSHTALRGLLFSCPLPEVTHPPPFITLCLPLDTYPSSIPAPHSPQSS